MPAASVVLCQGDVVRTGIADSRAVMHHIPVLPTAVDSEGGALWRPGKDPGSQVGPFPDTEGAGLGGDHPGAYRHWLDKGNAEILRQGKDDVSGNALDIFRDPVSVIHVVVISEFNEDR